jgi:SWI/SNF related-matrix-associated actin-dependent regulator of chromatin subfamily C
MSARPIGQAPLDTRHFKVLAKTHNTLVPVSPAVPLEQVVQSTSSIQKEKDEDAALPDNSDLPINIFAAEEQDDFLEDDVVGSYEEAAVHIFCKTCGIQAHKYYYHCIKMPIYNLCGSCFREGRFLMTLYSADFVRVPIKGKKQSSGGKEGKEEPPLQKSQWQDEELLLLLEGVEMYGGDDWDAVARHVGPRKTREDCIAKFISLPIQEHFLKTEHNTVKVMNPLLGADNPIMAVISFLASMVHPNVACAAAAAALAAYAKMKAEKREELCPKQSDQPMEEKLSKEQMNCIVDEVMQDAKEKAASLVQQQDTQITHTLTLLFEMYAKKMELKLQQMQALEDALTHERIELEKQRHALIAQRKQMMAILSDRKNSSLGIAGEGSAKESSMMSSPSNLVVPCAHSTTTSTTTTTATGGSSTYHRPISPRLLPTSNHSPTSMDTS